MMKRIVVVDDTKHLARGLAEVLELEGFETRFAFNGIEALTVMKVFVPNLVVTDLRMPKMDGFELITAIRHDEALREVPIIAITASIGHERRKQVIETGANLFVAKPFKDEQLLEVIKTLLNEEQY
jgi:CheY-like chemotaxis protein